MKTKKALVLLVLTLVLLAVALILPAAAYGTSPAGKAVSWVKVNTDYRLADGNFPNLTFHGATVARVEQLADDRLRGRVTVKVFREFYPMGPDDSATLFRYSVKTKAFTSAWWDYVPPGVSRADFFIAAADNWPADLGPAPDWWADYGGAAVADFVAYVPISDYPQSLPWLAFYTPYDAPTIPYRFMFIDSQKRGRPDVMLNWLFAGLPEMPWMPTVWTVPIQSGNIRVHVGN